MENSLQGRRFLIVEDDYLLACCLQDMLRREGAEVVGPASSVSEGIALSDEPLDGALLDINVRGEPVFALADRLLARDIPIVFCSGYDPHVLPEAYRHVPHCMKPFSPLGLAALLRDITLPGRPAGSGQRGALAQDIGSEGG
ncbi:MAG TPA: response regulator [Stenotrophomonas sp.]|jgi:CheY-like chemotaxis protein